MQKLALVAVASSLLSSVPIVDATPAPPAAPAPATPALTSLDAFGARLSAELARAKPANLVYSPASLSLALAMTREGARGETAAEMDAVLGANAGPEARALYKALSPAAATAGAPELTIANRLFGDTATPFEPAFVDVTRDGYGAPIQALDFQHHSADARAKINDWVERQTRERIKNLLPASAINATTRLVLVNAIYFKARWATPFAARATQPAQFAVDGAGNKQVATMRTKAHGRWGTHGGARTLDLPYASSAGGPQLSMLFVVPDQGTLGAVETAYAKDGVAPFLAATDGGGEVNVALPKFKIESDFELGETLGRMGMTRAFTDRAEFGGISKLATKISRVIHKAWVEVDEQGTEAAAATGVVMSRATAAAPAMIHDFAVDRSFLFVLHDAGGHVLFAGRVTDPS